MPCWGVVAELSPATVHHHSAARLLLQVLVGIREWRDNDSSVVESGGYPVESGAEDVLRGGRLCG